VALDRIIVLMMENNSFDRMLGALFPNRPDGGGIKGAEDKYWNLNPKTHQRVYVRPTQTREVKNDPGHELEDVQEQISGGCQGFVSNYVRKYPDDPQEIMGYYPDGALPALHSLAKNFAVCDRWFSSIPGPTWPNRFFALTGTSMGGVTNTGGPAQYPQATIFSVLSDMGISCRNYIHDASPNSAWANVPPFDTIAHFMKALSGPAANFPQFAFVEPHYGILSKQGQNDQHPPCDIMKGEKLIDDIYKVLRRNDALWKRTLLVITYDEHGGFYDHVEPPAAIPPDEHTTPKFDFKRLGVRVPTILVSPWLDAQVISDTFDHTSLLRFLLDKWGASDFLGDRVRSAQSFEKYLRKSPRATTLAAERIQVPPHMPALPQTGLSDNQEALLKLGFDLAGRIKDPAIRYPLLRPALNESDEARAQLATEQFQSFLIDQAKTPARPLGRTRKKVTVAMKRKRTKAGRRRISKT
jgi:phospholipase C